MHKLYCYVDESGQESRGKLFIVSVVVVEEERDAIRMTLEKIERATGKGSVKWVEARDDLRIAYIKAVLGVPLIAGKLCYSVYTETTEYFPKVVLTTARAIFLYVRGDDYKVTVFVDGLQKSLVKPFASLLRRLRVKTRKVRGIKDEAEALIRLADALSGFVRAAKEGRDDLVQLLEKAKEDGAIREL